MQENIESWGFEDCMNFVLTDFPQSITRKAMKGGFVDVRELTDPFSVWNIFYSVLNASIETILRTVSLFPFNWKVKHRLQPLAAGGQTTLKSLSWFFLINQDIFMIQYIWILRFTVHKFVLQPLFKPASAIWVHLSLKPMIPRRPLSPSVYWQSTNWIQMKGLSVPHYGYMEPVLFRKLA